MKRIRVFALAACKGGGNGSTAQKAAAGKDPVTEAWNKVRESNAFTLVRQE